MSGWIKLHRKMLEWEWYDDSNCFRVFTHLLLVANHKPRKWRGRLIQRGQRLTSLGNLAKETGLTISKVRTAISKLESTGEIASESHTQDTVFTIKNYDSYQGDDTALADQSHSNDTPIASESQTDDTALATNKNVNKGKNDQEGKEVTTLPAKADEPKSKKFSPPTLSEVTSYMGDYALSKQKTISPEEPEKFINFYESKGWIVGKKKMVSWQASVRGWVGRLNDHQQPRYGQPQKWDNTESLAGELTNMFEQKEIYHE